MSSNIKVQKICGYCGNEFTARTTVTQYCSHNCAKRAYKDRQRDEKIGSVTRETEQKKAKPVIELKSKAFLSISDASLLMGISRRTIYRMIERGELFTGKAGKRTLIQRSEIDKLFSHEKPVPVKKATAPDGIDLSDCYSLGEVVKQYKISYVTLNGLIKRNNVQTLKQWKYTYVPKCEIHRLLGQSSNI